ncbi:MAG: hypothetical protein M1818_005864 [Claussenomyces sp. TS43310]|nr:MAG: hypothetical protein M1818_005864 [Claussenomyces sp. TS43310]
MEEKVSENAQPVNGTAFVAPSNLQINNAVAKAGDLTTTLLHFLSTASNETICGIAIGLMVCTYLVLGKLGLLLIGALGGIVLHATWEDQNAPINATRDMRREKGLDVVKRILDLRQDAKAKDEENDSLAAVTSKGFEDFRPETRAALEELVDAVIKDYVKWWYSPILPSDESFPVASRQTLTSFIRSISAHLSRKRPADTLLDFLTNSTSIIIVFLNELSSALTISQGTTNLSASDIVHEYLLSNPESNLANILSEKQQRKKFKMVAEDILENFLDKSVYACHPARLFLKEILAGVVMEMTLKSCSRPEWLNGWIVYMLEDGEPDLNHAIDAGMNNDPLGDLDGEWGTTGTARAKRVDEKKHRKQLSKAEEAMEEAMEEAKRLSELMAEEDKKRLRALQTSEDAKVDVQSHIREISAPAFEPARIDEQRTGKDMSSDGAPISVSSREGVAKSPPSSPDVGGNVSTFTHFDQILSPQPEFPPLQKVTTSLTLHNAHITIHDDSSPGDIGRIRSKPMGDYWLQIEPESSQYPGWMILRKYPDFETLHEVLRRIAAVSGVTAFIEQHNALPSWKTHTKASLRGELERYLRDACWHQQLAESEGMKRFLEKDQAQSSSGNKNFAGLGWPTPAAFETMGKGMLDALTSAPKGAAEGGKAVLGGVTGVLGNIGSMGQKRKESTSNLSVQTAARASVSSLPKLDGSPALSGTRRGGESEENLRVSPIIHTQPAKIPPMERKPSYTSATEIGIDQETASRARSSISARSGRSSTSNSRDPSLAPSSRKRSVANLSDFESMALPPPPSDISDDYGPTEVPNLHHSRASSVAATPRTSTSVAPSTLSPTRTSISSNRPSLPARAHTPKRIRKEAAPLSESETRVAVELLFAMINELYTLSSAWNIRRTLLQAAKTFLLRPGNPSLTSIQALIQDSIIAAHTSDPGIALHLRKLRTNTMPTPEELKAWPAEMTAEEKEKLRIKAKKLLVERGVPAALMGVMGQAATGEAMGRIFECLQIEEVARGLMFGLILQGVRAMAH